MATDFDITVKGVPAVERALVNLDEDAEKAMVKEKRRLAKNLAAKLRRAVMREAYKRQGKLVRPTIHQSGDRVIAGPHAILNASEYGARGRYGWYAAERYRHSTGRQFRPPNRSGYWWNPTIQRSKPDADAAVQRALDAAVRQWGA